jgi:WD40 repeat protein
LVSGHTNKITDFAFSPDNAFIATSHLDGTVKIWNLQKLVELERLKLSDHGVGTITFSNCGHMLAIRRTNELTIWSMLSKEVVTSITVQCIAYGSSISFSPDGTYIYASTHQNRDQVSLDYFLQAWYVRSGDPLFSVNVIGQINHISVSCDGAFVAAAVGTQILVCDSLTGSVTNEITGPQCQATSVCFDVTCTRLVSGSLDGIVRIWDIQAARQLRSIDCCDNVLTVSISPEGRHVACAFLVGRIRVYDIDSGEEVCMCDAVGRAALFSAGGNILM